MREFQSLIGLGLVLVLTTTASAKGNKNVQHAVRGTVESVSTDSVVLNVRQSKKKGGETSQRTFQLKQDTLFEFVTVKKHAKGEKPETESSPANFSDVKPGATVQIATEAAAATKVSIMQGKTHGKKKAD